MFVDWVLAATHAPKVDIVGHSEGGTMPDYYIKFLGGSQVVAKFVMLSGVPHGTTFWGLSDLYDLAAAYGFSSQANALASFCGSCTEFLTGSSFMKALDAPNAQATAGEAATCPYDGAAVDGVSYTSIATEYDELVRPYNSDFIDPRCASAGRRHRRRQHHRAAAMPFRPGRPLVHRVRPGRRPGRAQRARPRARTARALHPDAAGHRLRGPAEIRHLISRRTPLPRPRAPVERA